MSTLDVAVLQSDLALRQRLLDTVLAVDRLRDAANDERELVSAAVGAMCGATHAEACLLSLSNEDTGQLELRAISDRLDVFARVEEAAGAVPRNGKNGI